MKGTVLPSSSSLDGGLDLRRFDVEKGGNGFGVRHGRDYTSGAQFGGVFPCGAAASTRAEQERHGGSIGAARVARRVTAADGNAYRAICALVEVVSLRADVYHRAIVAAADGGHFSEDASRACAGEPVDEIHFSNAGLSILGEGFDRQDAALRRTALPVVERGGGDGDDIDDRRGGSRPPAQRLAGAGWRSAARA